MRSCKFRHSMLILQKSNQEVGEPISSIIYKVINLGGLIALCLGIYGGVKQAHSNGSNPRTTPMSTTSARL